MLQVPQEKERQEAQLKSLECLADLKERCKDDLLTVFILDMEEKVRLNELLKKIGFYGPNSQINIIKDEVLLFRLNDDGQPGLYYVEDSEHIVDSTSPMIGIVQNIKTEEFDVYSQGGNWNFERHHKWTKDFSNSPEIIELADCMVDIVNAQLESEEVA